MRVTFLIPPALDGTGNVDRWAGCNYSVYYLPIPAVLYSATCLKDTVGRPSIVDFPAHKKTPNEFREFAMTDRADVYVFYTVFLSKNTDLAARKIIRDNRPDARFIYTGPYPTLEPGLFLDGREDTFVVRGEPEFIIRELIGAMKYSSDFQGVKGISYVKGSSPIHNEPAAEVGDLDDIPLPDRTLLDHTPYYNPKLRNLPQTVSQTSRGCFGRCWYCAPNSLSYARDLEHKRYFGAKPPPRLHSARRVIDEFADIARMGFKAVTMLDDEFLWDEKRTLEICEGIKGLGIEWACFARPDMVTENVAKAMAQAGCSFVDLGTESFDQDILDSIGKDMTPADTERAVHLLKKYKIQMEINVLYGATPKETLSTMRMTLKAVKRLNPDYVLFNIVNPYPGTDFYDAAKREGWMVYDELVPTDGMKNAVISYPHLTKKDLESFISYSYLTYYYLNPAYLLRQILNVRDPKDFLNKAKTAVRFFIKNFIKRE